MGARDEERGQALPLVAVVVALTGLLVLGIGRLGAVVVARAEAQAAADATALAGAARGRGAADVVAASDRARIVGWAAAGREVEVVVEVRGQRARARARRG
jgi:hypothetical protein